MLVSSRPRRTDSVVINASGLIGRRVLICPESFRIDHGGATRHGGELGSGDETATLAQRHEFTDAVTITGHSEGLPAFEQRP